MLDLQNLRELGRGVGRGREREEKGVYYSFLPSPLLFLSD